MPRGETEKEKSVGGRGVSVEFKGLMVHLLYYHTQSPGRDEEGERKFVAWPHIIRSSFITDRSHDWLLPALPPSPRVEDRARTNALRHNVDWKKVTTAHAQNESCRSAGNFARECSL